MNYENNSSTFGSGADQAWKASDVSESRAVAAAATSDKAKKLDEAGERLAAEMAVFAQVANELRAKRSPGLPAALRRRQVVETAAELFGVAPTWTAFYRETIGCDGVVRALFADRDELREFECSEEHAKVMEMLTVLRSRDLPENDPHEPQRMITVRMPKTLHDAICAEANDLDVSVNKLCITRMLQKVDYSMIPSSSQKRRGRRPGAAVTKVIAEKLAPSVEIRTEEC